MLKGINSYTAGVVLKSTPRKGIIRVKLKREKTTERKLKKTLSAAFAQ
jgi:hypothetical protein